MRTLRVLLFFVVATASAPCARSPAVAPFEMRVAVSGALDAVSPVTSAGGRNSSTLAQNWVFEALTRLDENGQLAPALASRVERREGGKIYVELRPGATFSDSSPVTEQDVRQSLARHQLTLRSEGLGFLIEARAGDLPAEVVLAQVLVFREQGASYLGSGPFIVAAADAQSIRLRRRVPAPGRIAHVELVAYPTPRDAFAHTLKGDTNLIADVEPRWLEFFAGVPRLQIVRGHGTHTESVALSLKLSRKERLALVAALERDDIRKLAFGDECGPVRNRALAQPEPHGRPLRVLTWPPAERFALAVRRSLAAEGGELTTVPAERLLEELRSGQFDLAAIRFLVWPASTASLLWHTGSPFNFLGYSNAEVDRALDRADWPAAEAALRADPPAAFVCTRDRVAIVDARIKNARVGPYDMLESLPEWEVGP